MSSAMPPNSAMAEVVYAPWKLAFPITPGAAHKPARGLYTGSGGTIVCRLVGMGDADSITFANVAAGVILPIIVAAVLADDGASPAVATDATGIVGGF